MNRLTYDYNQNYNPSAPFIELMIDGYEATRPPLAIEAFLDSGADGTMIPIAILTAVGAEYEDTVWMSGTAGGRQSVDRYTVRIQIGGVTIHSIHAIAIPSRHEAIIGRDILNYLVVALNGPAGVTELLMENGRSQA